MQKEMSFTIRPLSLEHEMDGRLSLTSTKVEIPIETIIRLSKTRDLTFFLRHYGANQKIIVDADFFLKMTEAPFEARRDNSKLLFPLAILMGIGIGIMLFIPLYFGISLLMFAAVSILVFGTGIIFGWILSKKDRERWQAFFEKAEENLYKWRNKILED